jgi:hypothetical protein
MNQNQIKAVITNIETQEDPLGIKAIAEANNQGELIQAFEKAKIQFQKIFDGKALIELQEIAKEVESGLATEETNKRYIEKYQEVLMANAFVNGKVVEASVNVWHQNHVVKMRETLIIEHDAKSASELMIIDLAINAYFRSLHTSKIYSSLVQGNDGTVRFEQSRVNLLKELGKQVENANKQFLSALTLLKEMKQPRINIKVQSKQAFVAQNQQFNKNA